MTSCSWHCSAPLSVFLSHPLLRSLKSNGHFSNVLPASSNPTSLSHPHTHIYTAAYAHINTLIQTDLWGCPKVSVAEGRTQKLRKQLGVREAMCHCLLSCCCVGRFTDLRNNPPSGSPSSFVDREVSWHGSVPGWRCC